jgi:hypothetical protein
MPFECPNCHASEFEKRGNRRCYFELDENLQEGPWNEGEIDIDVFDKGEDIIYCAGCENEWREEDLIETA